MRKICIAITVTLFLGVMSPAVVSAGEDHGFLFLMQVDPIAQLVHHYEPSKEPPMLDFGHISVLHLTHAILAAIILIFLAWYGAGRIRNRGEGE